MKFSTEKILSLQKIKNSSYWTRQARKHSLSLFHDASDAIPAYREFLNRHQISPRTIKTWDDFTTLPSVSKKDYLKLFPYPQVFRNGKLDQHLVYTATSGSTGVPYYFARNENLDQQYAVLVRQYLEQSSYGTSGPILVVIAFGMGIWIGGLITYKAFEIASRDGNIPVSIITPGINKKEIFNIFTNLAPHYSQVILVGYPPFVKDVIDEAAAEKIDFSKFKMRLLFAAESFSDKFRSYVCKKAGIGNCYRDTLNIYGSADIGAMAYETPLSILVREISLKNPAVFSTLFQQITKVPTLGQFNPLFTNFEEKNGELLLTGDNAIPLIRYAIGDHGGVFTYDQLKSLLAKNGIDIMTEAKRVGIDDTVQELPFVYVYERNDLSTTLYGLQVYPGTVRDAIMHPDLEQDLTGKLVLQTAYDEEQNQYLGIYLELKQGRESTETIAEKALSSITDHLMKTNSEFHHLSDFLKGKVLLKIFLKPHGDPQYFPSGTKQKWIRQ